MSMLVGHTINRSKNITTYMHPKRALTSRNDETGATFVKTSARRARRPDNAITLALCLLGIAMLGLWCAPSTCWAEDSITAAEFWKQRPANFFREVLARDATVCGSILQSLNQPYTRAAGPRQSQRLLMHTSYLLENWRKIHVNWVTADGRSVLQSKEQLIADVNNDGRKDAIYRWKGSLSGTVSEDMAVSLNPTEDELFGAELSFDSFREILEPTDVGASGGPVIFTKRTVHAPQAEISDDQLYWWEVISWRGTQYLMSSKVLYWQPTAVTSVLQYFSPTSLGLVCQFRGALNIDR
ncbi:hypothetical protein [Hypericibacter sp.]|uniref:hypothetical protein n=1 Tax=Hypericibacter sp. TaxID=2705401 RepID=UPI003D6D03AA